MHSKLVMLVAATALAAGSAGAQTQGISANEIVIGSMQDLSGPIASLGKASRNGMLMRIEEQNEKGGVHGRKIRFIVEDHAYDPKRAVLAAHKLLEQDRIFLMLGHIGAVTNIAVMPLMFERNVMNLFPFSPASQMFDPVHRLKFASFTPYYDQMRQSVPLLIKQRGLKKPCILYQDDESGIEHLKGTEDGLKTIDMQIVEKTSYKRGATDFSSQIARMKSAGCDLVVLGTLVRETIGAVSEAKKIGFAPVFLGTTMIYYDQIHKLGGPAMDGIVATHTAAVPYADGGSAEVRDWIQRYKTRFGEEPWMHSVYGYAYAQAMIVALDKAGRDLSTEALIRAIESTRFPTDIFGSPEMTFSATKRLGSSLFRFAEIRNGRWVTTSEYFGER